MKLNIGQNLRNLRRAADMTQDELAEKLGVAFQTVSRWENGGSYPDIEFLPIIAGIFDVTVDHLLGTDQEKKRRQLDEIVRRLQNSVRARPKEDDTVIEILRELRRDMRLYADCIAWMHSVWLTLRWYQGNASPELLEEVRLFHQEYCLYAPSMEDLWWPAWAMTVIEDDEHLTEHLKKYCTEKKFTVEELLLDRYSLRGEEENISRAEEICRYTTLRKLFEDNPSLTVNDRGMTEYSIAVLHLLNGVTPAPEHPVSGDGKPDLWIDIRVRLGWRLAEILLDREDIDAALTVLSDVTGLCETLAEEAERAKKRGKNSRTFQYRIHSAEFPDQGLFKLGDSLRRRRRTNALFRYPALLPFRGKHRIRIREYSDFGGIASTIPACLPQSPRRFPFSLSAGTSGSSD